MDTEQAYAAFCNQLEVDKEYAKEVIKGESYLALSNEEKEAISKALTVDEEIQKMVDESENEDIM